MGWWAENNFIGLSESIGSVLPKDILHICHDVFSVILYFKMKLKVNAKIMENVATYSKIISRHYWNVECLGAR